MLQKQKRVQFKTARVSTEFRGYISAAACAGGQPAGVCGGLKGSAGVRPGLSHPACAIPSPLAKPEGKSTPRPFVQAEGTCTPQPCSSFPVDGTPAARGPGLESLPPFRPPVCLLGEGWGSEEGSGSGEVCVGGGGGGRGTFAVRFGVKKRRTEQKRARRSQSGRREEAAGGASLAVWRLPVVPGHPEGSAEPRPLSWSRNSRALALGAGLGSSLSRYRLRRLLALWHCENARDTRG